MHKLKHRISFWFAVLALSSLYSSCGATASEENKPNIVLIYADDLGYGDVQSYNPTSKIPTPHIDQLAKEGIAFTDAHSAASACTPSRYSLLTGKYSFRSSLSQGVLWTYDLPLITPGEKTLASFLKSQGYDTGIIGKWHLGFDWPVKEPISREVWDTLRDSSKEELIDFSKTLDGGPNVLGFDYFFGMDTPNFPPYAFLENGKIVGELPQKVDSFQIPAAVPGVQQLDWDNYRILPTLKEKALGFLEEKSKTQNPFFLFFSLTAPHTPIAPNEPFKGKSEAGDYGDFVAEVDDLVGQVTQKLDQLGMRENTIIIFTSDNGSPGHSTQGASFGSIVADYGHHPSGPWRGIKGDSWEGGHRVPFIVSWKNHIPQNEKSDQLICQTDILATCYDLMGHPLPEDIAMDSYSLLPVLLNDQQSSERNAIVHFSSTGELSIRSKGWKLIKGKGSGGLTAWIDPEDGKNNPWPGQLYNLNIDPGEQENLYGNEKYEDKIRELENLLKTIKENQLMTLLKINPGSWTVDPEHSRIDLQIR